MVFAAKDGVVVAACGYYKHGGMDPLLKARSNFVVIRHLDGLYYRYFHLAHNGALVQPGRLSLGIHGLSGNTGYCFWTTFAL